MGKARRLALGFRKNKSIKSLNYVGVADQIIEFVRAVFFDPRHRVFADFGAFWRDFIGVHWTFFYFWNRCIQLSYNDFVTIFREDNLLHFEGVIIAWSTGRILDRHKAKWKKNDIKVEILRSFFFRLLCIYVFYRDHRVGCFHDLYHAYSGFCFFCAREILILL